MNNGESKIFDELGRYVLEHYDHQRPFSSFLPGIAGLQGIPMWVFYVNRGQGVCSFGVEDKDHPILEFQSANRAYQNTAVDGFRTFLNGVRQGKSWHREAFSPWEALDVERTMMIGMNELEIQEINRRLGYQVNVIYFMLPNLPFSALVRRVSFKNLLDSPLSLEVLDGLPGIVPYGVDNGALKHIGRTIEAWMCVNNLENKLPFYQLKATPGDTAAVHAITSGNYALAFEQDGLLPVVADHRVVFGMDTSFAKAHQFDDQGLQALFKKVQILEGRSLCAFFGTTLNLSSGDEKVITSLYGYSRSLSSIQSRLDLLQKPGFIEQKCKEANCLTEELTHFINTESASKVFDGYCRQTYLDNVLRGGFPLVLGGQHVTHVYSRKHGDIERDYNHFVTPPEYYSQGNGNFRDVNQNRRSDVFFVPQAGEFNIRMFMSLTQSDGYNPLVINGLTFTVPEARLDALLAFVDEPNPLEALMRRKFSPGELLDVVIQAKATIPAEELFEKVFSQADAHIEAEHGEGYWVDHWTYNLDLIEAYLAIFPEKKKYLLFESDPLPFFDDAIIVQPQAERYVLYEGKPRQLNDVCEDPEKKALIQSRAEDQNWARADHGRGEIFRLPLISKLALLCLIKFATRDPEGMGIQMEAGRPGWYDALNGLPGLFGSSMPETCELLRLVDFLIDAFQQVPQSISLPSEAQVFLDMIGNETGQSTDDLIYWNKLTQALEAYRESTRLGFRGDTIAVQMDAVLREMRTSLQRGITKAESFGDGVLPTYFIFEAIDYELTGTQDGDGNPHIQVNQFKPVPLPSFLEGPVRLMKILDEPQARQLDQAVKKSALFDQKLNMYKVNAPLVTQSHEIGRARAFTPGWLENESIWLHMSFKYLLELLSAGLFEEYFTALKAHLPAFMAPEVYGRSPLENSSFIVSSAHPDTSLHGNGFVARLSGSTAEFLSLWVLMTVGKGPFRLEDGQLVLAFSPILPGWLFKADGTFKFRFLGQCDVVIHNPQRLNTYDQAVKIKKIELHTSGDTVEINGALIPAPYAERVRLGAFDSITLYY